MKLRNVIILAFLITISVSATITLFAVNNMFLTGHEAQKVLVIMVGASVIGLGSGYLLLRPTFHGIRTLSSQTQAIAKKDLTAHSTITHPQELASLSADLNDMTVQLQDAFAKLEQVNHERNIMVAQLSHDIKTPLTSIRTQTEAIIDGVVSTDEVPNYLASIEQQVDRLSQLTDALQSLVTAENPHLNIETSDRIYVDQLLVMILNGLKPQLQQEQRDVNITLPEATRRLVSNQQAVERIIQNLLTNALKYSPQGTDIDVSVAQTDFTWKLTVTDHGNGLTPDEQEKIFDRMYRVDASRNSQTGGSGLGLYIARQLARQLGGDLTVYSHVDKGSAFTLSLPNQVTEKSVS